ncbi:MAG: GMC oxidoreductase, partial [Pseudonocardiaceae bacterium]
PMLAVTTGAPAPGDRAPGRGYEVVLRASSNTVDSLPSEYAVHPVHAGTASSPMTALFVFLHRCDSRGVLRLRSPDPTVAPVLDERMLSDMRDLARMRAAVRHTIELARRPELRSSGQRIGLTGAEWSADDIVDDRTLDALLLAEVTDAKHVAATCPMGRPGADGVVVDPRAQVVGVTGLRVADCSIMPTVPRANTYLTAVMIGERVAELIRGEGAVS